jgi:hypothetical protein
LQDFSWGRCEAQESCPLSSAEEAQIEHELLGCLFREEERQTLLVLFPGGYGAQV